MGLTCPATSRSPLYRPGELPPHPVYFIYLIRPLADDRNATAANRHDPAVHVLARQRNWFIDGFIRHQDQRDRSVLALNDQAAFPLLQRLYQSSKT